MLLLLVRLLLRTWLLGVCFFINYSYSGRCVGKLLGSGDDLAKLSPGFWGLLGPLFSSCYCFYVFERSDEPSHSSICPGLPLPLLYLPWFALPIAPFTLFLYNSICVYGA